jgi:hypothetical protein
MRISRRVIVLTCALYLGFVHADEAADQAHRQVVMTDLFAVISLSGLHCEKVVDYELISAMNYIAICSNGMRYRVGVSPEGRVQTTVTQQK